MAVAVVTGLAPEGYFFDLSNMELAESSNVKGVFRDDDTNYYMVVEGEDLTYSEGALSSGTVTSVALMIDESTVISLTGLSLSGAELWEAYWQQSPRLFWNVWLMHGSDIVTGSDNSDWPILAGSGKNVVRGLGGADYIYGGSGQDIIDGGEGDDLLRGFQGRDILTGGGGRDIFLIDSVRGNDIILDFDLRGPIQDAIGIQRQKFELRDSGDDIIIDIKHGPEIRLLDVDFDQFDARDNIAQFSLFPELPTPV